MRTCRYVGVQRLKKGGGCVYACKKKMCNVKHDGLTRYGKQCLRQHVTFFYRRMYEMDICPCIVSRSRKIKMGNKNSTNKDGEGCPRDV
jgi:hypothetical protein